MQNHRRWITLHTHNGVYRQLYEFLHRSQNLRLCFFSLSKKGDTRKKGAAASASVVGCSAHPSQVANLSPLFPFFEQVFFILFPKPMPGHGPFDFFNWPFTQHNEWVHALTNTMQVRGSLVDLQWRCQVFSRTPANRGGFTNSEVPGQTNSDCRHE